MRALIIFCLLATAYSKPQGYNYNQQQQPFQIKVPDVSSSVHVQQQHSSSVAQEGHSFLQQALQNPKVTQSLLGAPQSSYIPPAAGSVSAAAPLPAPPQNYYQPQPQPQPTTFRGFQPSFGVQQPLQQPFAFPQQHRQQQQQQLSQQQQTYQTQYQQASPPVVTKDIYVHVAPEENEEHYQHPVAPLPPPPPRKHYRIVFIKAPTPTASSAAVRVKQAPTEEKTIIYVLTKKPDPLDLDAAFQQAEPKQPSKPEVYFIKYRTQEEAQHAQRTIQAQYDQLGGTTQVSDEGVAPVTSVIGALEQQQGSAGTTGTGDFSSSGAGASTTGLGISASGSGSSSGGYSSSGSGSYSSSGSSSSSFSSTSSSSSSSGSGGASKYLPPIVRL